MPQIEADPRHHSHLYELKPLSRWWLLAAAGIAVVLAFGNGWEKPITWALLLVGFLTGFAVLLVFPRFWLSKINDQN